MLSLNPRRVDDLFNFIHERHRIWRERYVAKKPGPWTTDPILQTFRFCNVYRELDRVTLWITSKWRTPNAGDPDLWFAMVVARLVNWPDTLDELKYPVPWSSKHFVKVLEDRKKHEEKIFTGAYMIHAGRTKQSKAQYLAEHVLTPIWKSREEVRPRKGETLASFYERLYECPDMGSFMSGQVIADTKYEGVLKTAEDWFTWAISGPGSLRGLNRVFERDKREKWKEKDWKEHLDKLRAHVHQKVRQSSMPYISAQDLQNCLCEFDKYERVRLGEGRPRALFVPGTEPLRFPRQGVLY